MIKKLGFATLCPTYMIARLYAITLLYRSVLLLNSNDSAAKLNRLLP